MILNHNHLVIVPDTQDEVAQVPKIKSLKNSVDTINIELFGDDLMFGRDPDQIPPESGVGTVDQITAKIPTPPDKLIQVFLPQFLLEINNRSVGNTTSGNLLNGDGVNSAWPDNIQANIVVINHGLHDAKSNVDIEIYKNNLISLRQGLSEEQIMVWQTPAETLTVNTAPYATAMIEVANQFGDFIADTRKIKNWTNELPDGEHPRQIGYARWIDLVLSEKINSAILKHLGPDRHEFYRQDYQEKFILDEQKEISLSFTPPSSSWIEIYHRKNQAYYAVSRGNVDISTNPVNNIRGHLAGGLHSVDTGEQLVTVTNGYTLMKIRRDDGNLIYRRTFNIASSLKAAKLLADALNQTSSDYIIIITTYQEPKANRLTPELKEAMFRCGASAEIFGSLEFKSGSAYILIGIPGVGTGGGLESYAGKTDHDPYAYCDIEFEIASNGIPYARDIFPPVAYVESEDNQKIPLINPIYDLVSGVPPINGERILNPRYPTYLTNGIPGETYVIRGRRILFNEPLTGIVTVICDTQSEPSKNGVIIDIDNLQSYDRYIQRFNPARWAPGRPQTFFPPPGLGPLDPRQVQGASGVNALGLYNTQLNNKVGSSLYSEPFVLSQPNFGYVRISTDRKKMIYVPFPNIAGMDSFSYTLMTQHGQTGMPKCVDVKIVKWSYRLSANVQSINEGDECKFILSTDEIPDGTIVPYTVTGISSVDIVESTSGNFVIGDNVGKIIVTTIADRLTEGDEILTLKLDNILPSDGNIISSSVIIVDVSKNPSYQISANTEIIDEGGNVQFVITTTEVNSGTLISYTVTGISESDIFEPLNGTVTITNNIGEFILSPKLDILTEGTETLTVTLNGILPTGSNIISSNVEIIDISLSPNYQIESDVGQINEGEMIRFLIKTTNVSNGEIISYTISGVDQSDIIEPLTGTFIVNNNIGAILITTIDDHLTEGNETLTVTLENIMTLGNTTSANVVIVDTSLGPEFVLSANTNTVNEESMVKFILNTQRVPDYTYVNYILSGVSPTDIDNEIMFSNFQIINNHAEKEIAISSDDLIEGTETLTISLPDVLPIAPNVVSCSVSIIDTSYTVKGLFLVEGDSGNVQIIGVGPVTAGEVITYVIENYNNDISSSVSGIVVLDQDKKANISVTAAIKEVASLREHQITITGPNGTVTRSIYIIGIGELVEISCSDPVQNYQNDPTGKDTIYKLNVGTNIGQVGIQYDAYVAPDYFSIWWNGKILKSGLISGQGTLVINKTSAYPDWIVVWGRAGGPDSAYEFSVICP